MPAEPHHPRPSRNILPLYYAVQVGKTVLWVSADLVAFYVLGTVQRLPAADVALVLMGGLVWHGLSDYLVGQWLERRRTDSRVLAIIAGVSVPIASATFVLAMLLAAVLPWAALAMMMASRSAYALFDVPHHALIARMARRGLPPVRIVGLRNLWGQLAVLALGLGLAPALGPIMTRTGLGLVLAMVAVVSAVLSAPIAVLIRDLWDVRPDESAQKAFWHLRRSRAAIAAVLATDLAATVLVATMNKLALAAIAPGLALAILSAGRIVASVPLPARWHERHLDAKLLVSFLLLAASIAALSIEVSPVSLLVFGLASGWINIFIWAWLGRATDHPRTFGFATMLTKFGLLASIPIASRLAA